MAAPSNINKSAAISKTEYLKRYLSTGDNAKKKNDKNSKKKRVKVTGRGMKIVDDDVDWKQLVTSEEKDHEEEEEEEEAPVVAELIDERPEEVKMLEAFRTSTKWRVMGDDDEAEGEERESHDSPEPTSRTGHDSPEPLSNKKARHDSPEHVSIRRTRHDSPEALSVQKARNDSLDTSPPTRTRHDSPDLSPRRQHAAAGSRHQQSPSAPQSDKHSSRAQKNRSRDSSQVRKKDNSSLSNGQHSPGSDQSPPRRRVKKRQDSDSDQSPPRKRSAKAGKGSDSDQSPPRRKPRGGGGSDSDLSPPRRPDQSQGPRMLSGGAAGLVSIDILRKEQEENRRREKNNQPLEEESRNAQTIFRDKGGKRRDLESEREEQRKKAGEKAEKDAKYAQWGKGLAQSQMQQENIESALVESQKPLARHRDDEDLDRMLREQLRDGDPMAAMLQRKRDRDAKLRGVKEKPRYKGPMPPPNRFNLPPGYRWDGVDRSNGFEQKRYTRMADKKAVQDMAYKWSVEDM
ncbi:BUD13 homolog [Aplochiton taeniatus]